MYKDNSQLRIEDFVFPYGKLDPENDWVRLAALVPWDVAEERYAARFVNNGPPAHPARMALGALLIQRRLKCSDQWLVKHIGENPYLQYFIGMKEYGPCPFGASTLVAFRKRFSEEDLAAILEASVPKADTEEKDDSDDGNDPPNSGTLVLDATCCPADVAYPQDIDLLNQAREKAEKTVDELCKLTGQKKPRMYRKRARIERLDFEPFNESEDLWRAVARYRERYGCYPERILADKLYRNRQTLAFSKEHGIRLSAPALGKPPKDSVRSRQAKKQEYQDSCDHNAVEGIFGTAKTAYGLGRIMARLQVTAVCVIGVVLLLLNLSRSLRAAFALFCVMSVVAIFRGCGVDPS